MKRGKRGMSSYVAALIFSLTVSFCCIEAGQQGPVPLGKQIDDISLVASSRELAVLSAGSLQKDPELGLLIALEAIRKARTAEAEEALRRALVESRVRTVLRTPAPARVADADISPDGKTIVTAVTNTVRWWDAETGRELRSISLPGSSLRNIAFCPDGRRIIVVRPGEIRLFDAATGNQIQEFSGGGSMTPDGRYFIVHQNSAVQVWDAVTGRQVFQFQSEYQPLGYSPKSGLMTLSGPDQTFHVWDVQAGKYIAEFRGHTHRISSAAFSPDGTLLATSAWCAWGDYDPTVQVWNAKTGSSVAVLREHPGCVAKVLFSPDGRYIITTCVICGTTRIWDADTGKKAAELAGHQGGTSFSPDSKYLAGNGANGTICVWSVATGSIAAALHSSSTATKRAAFAPDGKHIVACPVDGGICTVWESGSWREVPGFSGEADFDHANLFSPDGRFVVVYNGDVAAMIEIASGKTISQLSRQRARINRATFSPDGRYVATFNQDGTAVVYPWEMFAPLDDLLALAPKRVTRTLSCEERRLYLHGPPCPARTP